MADISNIFSINSSRLATIFLWIAAITGITAAIASLLSAIFSNNATKVAEKKTALEITRLDVARREFDNRIREAQTRTALAEAAIAEANRKSADLELEASRLRLTLQSATREITGRFITETQSRKLASEILGTYPEFIIRHANDEESSSFARSVRNALRGAGAEVGVSPPYQASYTEDSIDWYPVEITPPKHIYNVSKSLEQLMADPVVKAVISSGIADAIGSEEDALERDYLIFIPMRAGRREGTLERSSTP